MAIGRLNRSLGGCTAAVAAPSHRELSAINAVRRLLLYADTVLIPVETLPNSEQPIVPANRRRQIPGEVVAVNQTRGRMQKYRRGRRDACIEHAQ